MKTKKEKILVELQTLICENLPHKVTIDIKEETMLENDLGFSSLDFIIVFVSIEEAYNITMNDADLSYEKFKTIGNLIDYILEKTEGT